MEDVRANAQILSYLASASPPDTSGAAISKATGLGSSRLYPALVALQNDDLIIGWWDDSPSPRRRFYALTWAGRERVGTMQPVQAPPPAGTGNWFWRKFVAPFFGG